MATGGTPPGMMPIAHSPAAHASSNLLCVSIPAERQPCGPPSSRAPLAPVLLPKAQWELQRRVAELTRLIDGLNSFLVFLLEDYNARVDDVHANASIAQLTDEDRVRLQASHRQRQADILSKLCLQVVRSLMSHKWSWPFNAPVDTQRYPDYTRVITDPIDLGTIKTRIEKGGHYKGPLEVRVDTQRVFSNAKEYNPPGSDVHIMASTLADRFSERWREQVQPRLDDEKSVLVQEKVSAILRRAQTAIEGKLMGLDEAVAAALALVDALEAMVVAARCEAAAMCTAMSAAQQEVVAKAYAALPSEHKSIVGSLLPPGDLTALLGSPGCPRSLRPPRRNRRVSICAPVAPNLFALTHLAGPMGEVPQEVDPKSVDALVLHEMLVAMTELSGGAHAPEAGAGDACADQGGPSVAGQGPAGEGGAQGPDAGGVKAGGPKSAEGAAVARAWQVLGEKRRAVFDLSGVAVARGAVMRGRDGRKARRREVSWGQQAPAAALLALDLPSHVREALHKALEDEERLSRAREAERVGASTEEAGPDGEDGAGDGGGGDGVESGMAEEPPNGE